MTHEVAQEGVFTQRVIGIVCPDPTRLDVLIQVVHTQYAGQYTVVGIGGSDDELRRLAPNPPLVVIVDTRTSDIPRIVALLTDLHPTPRLILMAPSPQKRTTYAGVGVAITDDANIEALQEALETALFAIKSPKEVLEFVATFLKAKRRDIVARWLQRIASIPEFAARPDLNLIEMRDDVPLMISALIEILEGEPYPTYFRPGSEAYSAAITHAHTRHAQGLSPSSVIQEHYALRTEIWQTLKQPIDLHNISGRDIFLLEERLNYILDNIVLIAFDHFMHHRG